MRALVCLAVALCIPALGQPAAGQQKLSRAEQEVVDAQKARVEAGNKRDGSWARYVADDCIFSDDNGALVTKAQMMRFEKLPPEYDRTVNQRDYVVHVYGNTAVMTFRGTVHEQFPGSDIISEMRMTETYLKQNGSWLLVARHWGKLPVNFRKPVAVDSSVYKDYVGQYEWRPHDDLENISVKDGKLWTQSGKDPAEEYFPAGGGTFFLDEDLGTATFTRDAQGHVTGYTYRGADGQEVQVKKIK